MVIFVAIDAQRPPECATAGRDHGEAEDVPSPFPMGGLDAVSEGFDNDGGLRQLKPRRSQRKTAHRQRMINSADDEDNDIVKSGSTNSSRPRSNLRRRRSSIEAEDRDLYLPSKCEGEKEDNSGIAGGWCRLGEYIAWEGVSPGRMA